MDIMDKDQLKDAYGKLGIQFTEMPTDSDDTHWTWQLTLPDDMNCELAAEVLPSDMVNQLKNRPKPKIEYYKP